MTDFQVTRVRRVPGQDTHVSITHLGGHGWEWTREEVVQALDAKSHTFYVVAAGRRLQVAPIRGAIADYLRTQSDGHWTDDLLSMPEC
jgi:hypothetical protein